jgi:hypothetical protein
MQTVETRGERRAPTLSTLAAVRLRRRTLDAMPLAVGPPTSTPPISTTLAVLDLDAFLATFALVAATL